MNHEAFISSFKGRNVMVLGDLMLDHYIWGKVERISQEAPVPIVEATKEECRLGGAANVAFNLRALGAKVNLIGIHGEDEAGSSLVKILADAGIGTDGLVSVKDRRTTLKTRILSRNQQIVRVDYEDNSIIDESTEARLVAKIKGQLAGCEALIIEDYDKGMLSAKLISSVIALCKNAAIPIAIDPKLRHFFQYQDVTIFKPNYFELQNSLGQVFTDEQSFIEAATELRTRLNAKFLVVTRGAKGMSIFSDGPVCHLPTVAREVFDVSGAGDTVISVLTLGWISGAPIDVAAKIANHAAGVVCGKRGIAVASAKEILDSINDQR